MDTLDLLEAAAQVGAGEGDSAICRAHQAAAGAEGPTPGPQSPAEEGGQGGVGPEAGGAGLGHIAPEHEAIHEDGDNHEHTRKLGLGEPPEMTGEGQPGKRAIQPDLPRN